MALHSALSRRAPAPAPPARLHDETPGATTAMQVAADLRRRILQGELSPGQRLKIDDIAALCDVSHMPVRAALQELESEGVLDVYPHRGAVIRGVDARFVRNLLELRAAIEVMLTEHCAHAIDKAGLAELEALARDFEAAARARGPGRDRQREPAFPPGDQPRGRQPRGVAGARSRTPADRGVARALRLRARAHRRRDRRAPSAAARDRAQGREAGVRDRTAPLRRRARRAAGALPRWLSAREWNARRGDSSGSPAKNAARLSTTIWPIACRVACVPLPVWGCRTTLSSANSASGILRLVREDVESRSGEPLVHQRIDEIRLVHRGPARDVDEVALRAERVDHVHGPTSPRVSSRPGIAQTRIFTLRASSAGVRNSDRRTAGCRVRP